MLNVSAVVNYNPLSRRRRRDLIFSMGKLKACKFESRNPKFERTTAADCKISSSQPRFKP